MEEILSQFLNSGPVGIIAAAVVYLVIVLQRNETKKSRDNAQDDFDKRITLLEHDCEIVKSQMETVSTKLDKICDLLTSIQIELAKKKDKD